MPITLGCPSCGKRFRARDESAGKRVKCPYCQAAVPVPSADDNRDSAAPTDVIATSGSKSDSVPNPEPRPAAASSPALFDVAGKPNSPPPPPPPASRKPVPAADLSSAFADPKPGKKAKAAQTPQEMAAGAWRKTKGGLCWVLLGLFFLVVPGFVPFARVMYESKQGELPKGDGWVKIEGYVNGDDKDTLKVSKSEELIVAGYVIPVILGGLCLAIGRMTAGAAPRSSGAKGLFAMSGLFTLVALGSFLTAVVCKKMAFQDVYKYTVQAAPIAFVTAEFWYLVGLAAAGAALKRPKPARTVLLIGFLAAVIYAGVTIGWEQYTQNARKSNPPLSRVALLEPLKQRDKDPDPDMDSLMLETGAIMLGWLLLIGLYWRATSGVRGGIRDHLEASAG